MRKDNTVVETEIDNSTGLPCGIHVRTGMLVTKGDEDVRVHLLKGVDVGKYPDWETAMADVIPFSTVVPDGALDGEEKYAVLIMCDLSAEGRSELIKELHLEELADRLRFGESCMVDAMYKSAGFKPM